MTTLALILFVVFFAALFSVKNPKRPKPIDFKQVEKELEEHYAKEREREQANQ